MLMHMGVGLQESGMQGAGCRGADVQMCRRVLRYRGAEVQGSDGHMQGAEAEAVGVGEGGVGDGVGVVVGVGLKMCRGADGQIDRWTDVHILCRYAEVVQRWCRGGAEVRLSSSLSWSDFLAKGQNRRKKCGKAQL